MLDLIITRDKLTINLSVTYQEYIQYPVDNTYNNKLKNQRERKNELRKEK